jgi:hypothetical protein
MSGELVKGRKPKPEAMPAYSLGVTSCALRGGRPSFRLWRLETSHAPHAVDAVYTLCMLSLKVRAMNSTSSSPIIRGGERVSTLL